ncbi:zinc-dependent alcohol dehydrogenase [Dactylosporangium matsuzakiense]|uniref:Sorbitol dehydrogenase n=1 Tax=Dactylosporangium matsuzakiense TaxID=53360 RepID=A0A9W6KKT1_9ACTN|nr:zinc-binding dehydrogenase [Dactylosporangium matsuzakiense]GLL03917.1 sorbitol dehydrogenase [Dactylosporangium matsuzakiense]
MEALVVPDPATGTPLVDPPPRSMNTAARLHGVRDIRVATEPAPVPGPGESLVEVTAVGLCGSDLHWYAEGGIGDARIAHPIVGGHEMAGVVRGGPLDGVRVAVDPAIPCHRCDMCRAGHPNLCREIVFAGHGLRDGGLQRYLAWPTERLHPLPPGLTDADGAMLEPLGVAVHAVDLGHIPLGADVAVLGAGPIGLLLIQVARAAGAARVLATDPLPHRRDAAAAYGADVVLDPQAGDFTAGLAAFTEGRGTHVAFEIAGTDPAIAAAVEVVRPGGRVVLGGIPSTDQSAFPAAAARRKGLTFAMVRRMKEVYPRAMALVTGGRVDVRALVTHRYALTDAAEAFAVANARKGLKVVIEPAGV